AMTAEVVDAFEGADFPRVIHLLDQHFGRATYSFRSLFRDEQRKVLRPIMAGAIRETEASATQVYEHHAPLLAFLQDAHVPLPQPLRALSELVLNLQIRRQVQSEHVDKERVAALIRDVQRAGVPLHEERLGQILRS